ncbi:hypothetical protein [Amycolatopsis sp. NPDC051371]|uniref:hypothetical protein n=1 Tax=Amycolatopsis sp. NPDC051371 TaxID=3155800 RepID=UPI00342E683F
MPSSDDQEIGGFSVSGGGVARRWTTEDMRRAVPLPTPVPPGQVSADDELAARVIVAAMSRLVSTGTVTVPQIAFDLGESREDVSACVQRLARP